MENNMRKIVVHCETNQCGTDSWEFLEVEGCMTNNELDNLAQEIANDNAAMYSIYPPSDDDTEEEALEADDSIGGCWYDYVPEKHDMYCVGTRKPY